MFGLAFRIVGIGGVTYVATKTVKFVAPHIRSAAEAVRAEINAFHKSGAWSH